MFSQYPEVARAADELVLDVGNFTRIAFTDGLLPEHFPKLSFTKSEQVEIELVFSQRLQFETKHFQVPRRVQRELIVCQRKNTLLVGRQMCQDHNGHLGEPELTGGEYPAMTGNDVVIRSDQDGVIKSEFPDARRNLCHLGFRMLPGISGGRDETGNRVKNDFKHRHRIPLVRIIVVSVLSVTCRDYCNMATSNAVTNRRAALTSQPMPKQSLQVSSKRERAKQERRINLSDAALAVIWLNARRYRRRDPLMSE